MSNTAERVKLGPPINLGEPVRSRISQGSVIGTRSDGRQELYTATNGFPCIFYAIDLETGKAAFSYEIPNTNAIWAMAISPEGDVYFTGTSDAILYRYDAEERKVETVGVNPSSGWVWELIFSPDGMLFGATYPESRVFEYNPKTRAFRDLGQMSPDQHYSRCAAVTDSYVYAGIGTAIGLVRHNRTSGSKEPLRLEELDGTAGFIVHILPVNDQLLFLATEKEMFAYSTEEQRVVDSFGASGFISNAKPGTTQHYYLSKGMLCSYDTATGQIEHQLQLSAYEKDQSKIKCMTWLQEADGRYTLAIVTTHIGIYLVDLDKGTVRVVEPDIPSQPVLIQVLEPDEQDRIYVGGYHRAMSYYNLRTHEVEKEIHHFPQTEGIGFHHNYVYFGTYTKAQIYRLDTTKPTESGEAAAPEYLFGIGNKQDRPFAIVAGEGKVFFGTIPDYGLLSGAFTVYDEASGEVEVYPGLIPNQSVLALAYRDGLVYGGTTNWGGIGIEAIEKEAKLFVYDVAQKKLIHAFTPDIPGIDMPPRMIGELTFGPDGLLWGAADGTIFAIDVKTMQVVKSKLIVPSTYESSHLRPFMLRWGPGGLLYTGLARKLIVVDPKTLDHVVWNEGPVDMIAVGSDGHVYYNEQTKLIVRHTSLT